jgi:hypothetical protein
MRQNDKTALKVHFAQSTATVQLLSFTEFDSRSRGAVYPSSLA